MSAPPADTAAIAYSTPFGDAWLAFSGDSVIELGLPRSAPPFSRAPRAPEAMKQLAAELAEYWRGGELPHADAVLDAAATTPLVDDIYRRVTAIPAGATMTYAEVAAAVGRPGAARAVGAAMAANRFAPVIPCHRVVGSDGSLRGYAAGLDVKRYLIDLEAAGADG